MPLRELASGKRGAAEPEIDIVAIHGLNAKLKEDEVHARETWTKNGRLWLQDDLPRKIPAARILLAVYDSNPAFGNRDRFVRQASSLLEEIRMRRDGVKDRPIVLVAHSLGGILAKQALVNARNNPIYEDTLKTVRGLVFFGVPHAGGDRGAVYLGNIAASIAQSIMPKGVSKDIMETLKDGSLYSDILKDMFRHQLENYSIVSFYERLYHVGKHVIVPYENATLGLAGTRENQVGLDANHSDICKFDTRIQHDRDLYEIAEFNINKTCERALETAKQSQEQARSELTQGPPDHACDFAIALETVSSVDGAYLPFKRGAVLEDVQQYKNVNETIHLARIRGRRGRIPGDSIIMITDSCHQAKLARCSSRALYQMAAKHGASFAESLFAERRDDVWPLQLSIENTHLDTCYVDWNGRLHPQALHLAVIGQDHDVLDFLLINSGKRGLVSLDSLQTFPALNLRHATQSTDEWELYVQDDLGSPLTAAANRYVACRYLDEPSTEWMMIVLKLLSNGSTWQAFINGKELLGPTLPAERADAGTILNQAIHSNHHQLVSSLLEAKPELPFDPLRAATLFNSKQWWTAPIVELAIGGEDAPPLLVCLCECLKSLVCSGHPLAEAVPSAMWERISELTLPQSLVDTLFCHLLQQLERWPEAPRVARQDAVLQQLRALLHARPDLDAWCAPADAERVSVLHFCVERALTQPLAAFLDDGRSAPNVNLPFPDGDLLLDRAEQRGDHEAVQLLRRHGAKRRNYRGPPKPEVHALGPTDPSRRASSRNQLRTTESEPFALPASPAHSDSRAAIKPTAHVDWHAAKANPYIDEDVYDRRSDEEFDALLSAAAARLKVRSRASSRPTWIGVGDPFKPPFSPDALRALKPPPSQVGRRNPFLPN